MKRFRLFILTGAALLLFAIVTACSSDINTNTVSDGELLLTAQAANPMPTEMSGLELAQVKTSTCQVSKFISVQVSGNQGDMEAWSPSADLLAYVTPENDKWGWFVGNLVVWDVKTQKAQFTSTGVQVQGDLTWSPDGNLLAYIVLDPRTKVYTVNYVDLRTGVITDVFSSTDPKTDSWSSPKGIDKWSDDATLLLTSSCDVDCSRKYSYDVTSGVLTAGDETRKNEDKTLTFTNQYTSPDSRWLLAVDTNEDLWIASQVNKQASLMLENKPVDEVKWSQDSSYFAVRTDDSILIFQPDCSK